MVGIHGADAGNQKAKNSGLLLIETLLAGPGFFALGLLSKPMLVTWPFVLMLLDEWPLRRFSNLQFSSSDVEKPLVGKNPLFCYWQWQPAPSPIWCKKHGGAVTNFERLSLSLRLENAMSLSSLSRKVFLAGEIWQFCIPCLVHGPHGWSSPVFLLLVAVTALVFSSKKQPFLSIGWLWFVGMLVPGDCPSSGGRTTSMADRYMYLPMIGLLIALVWGLVELGEIIHFKPLRSSLCLQARPRLPACSSRVMKSDIGRTA